MIQLNRNKSQGVVLVFGLIILSALAIIGSSSANMGIVNQKIVLNAQNAAEVFQAAETAGIYARSQSSWVNTALAHVEDPNYTDWPKYDLPLSYAHVKAEATLNARQALLQGFTLNAESTVSYIRLEAEGDASRDDVAKKVITQGWVRVGAG